MTDHFSAYLGIYNSADQSFDRKIHLGEFDSYDEVLEAYDKQRTDEAPHMIVAQPDDVIETDAPCQRCGNHAGQIRVRVITEAIK